MYVRQPILDYEKYSDGASEAIQAEKEGGSAAGFCCATFYCPHNKAVVIGSTAQVRRCFKRVGQAAKLWVSTDFATGI